MPFKEQERTMKQCIKALTLALITVGCAAEVGGPALEGESVETTEGTLLAEVTISDGHTVRFFEAFPGAVTISELTSDLSTALAVHLGPESLVEVYGALGVVPDPEVVERLAQAQSRVDRLNAEVKAEGPRPEAEAATVTLESTGSPLGGLGHERAAYTSETGAHPSFTAAEFKTVYCNKAELGADGQLCSTSATSADTGLTNDVSWLRSIVVNTASSGKTTHDLRHFVCVDSYPIIGCVKRAWRTTTTQSVARGDYGIYTDTFHWTRARASGNLFRIGAVWFFQ
jgi:hypothetical protein